ncbi:MAG: hypothetical protein U0174_22065 [Polyangiaceae bacterium]
MVQRILSLVYLGASFALALFILVQIAHKNDVGAGLGALLLLSYVGVLYASQRPRARVRSSRLPPATRGGAS